MIADTLPPEWSTSTLRELHAGCVDSLNPGDYPAEAFEYYSIPAYQAGGNPQVVCGRDILSQKLLIPHQCLLFGKLNPRVEKVWNVESSSNLRRLASTEWLPIVPTGDLDKYFGYYLLWSEWVLPIAQRLVSGSTPSRQRVEPASFYNIQVPLPPIEEQRSIGDLLGRVDAAISAQDTSIAVTHDSKRAAMQALFTRGLRGEAQKETEIGPVPESWLVESLGAHHSVVSGGTPSRTNPAYWQGGSIPWIKTAEVDYRVITETEEHITPVGLNGSAAKLLSPGTLILAMYGQGATRARVAILGIEAACNQACAAMNPTDGAVDTKYLYHYLTYRYHTIRQMAHGGQQQNLNLDIVRDVPVAFSLDKIEQREIVAILDAIDRKIDLHRRKREILNDLFKTLLHKLMTGEIRVSDLDLSALERTQIVPAAARA